MVALLHGYMGRVPERLNELNESFTIRKNLVVMGGVSSLELRGEER